jgi:predicted O-methyltransferase YrrM
VDWVSQQAPARIMEIGTASGATLLAWCRIASESVISVDLPGGIHGGGYSRQRQPLYRLFTYGRPNVSLHLLQKDSHLWETKLEVDAILGSRQLDILFIDGDHTLEGVTADYDLWRTIVKPGGFIIFHDILKHKYLSDVHVDVLWNRIKHDYPRLEIVGDPEQGWAGIGILFV